MLTVTVAVNGRTLIHRSAQNRTPEFSQERAHTYKCDDGRTILHKRSEGAAALAIKMLAGIHECDVDPVDLEAILLLHNATSLPPHVSKRQPKKKRTPCEPKN